MFNIELGAEVLELFIVKLSAVVGDDNPRKAESIDNRLLHELSVLSFSDLSHRLGFHPFCEVVNGYE